MCLFLDVVSHGSGGPDFALGKEQLEWLESQLQSACGQNLTSVVFMHAYPAALDGSDADALGAWPERHLLGTRSDPNRNGKQW
jgi:Icc protein